MAEIDQPNLFNDHPTPTLARNISSAFHILANADAMMKYLKSSKLLSNEQLRSLCTKSPNDLLRDAVVEAAMEFADSHEGMMLSRPPASTITKLQVAARNLKAFLADKEKQNADAS